MSTDYFEALIKTEKYETKNQIFLKTRVFKTLNNLIKTFFNDSFKKNQFLLDLGSSYGAFVEIAKKNGLNAKGLDIKDLNLEKDSIHLADESCDVVTAISLLEHLNQPDHLLKEVKRILKKNGYFIIVTPNWPYNVKTFFDDPTHVHPYSKKSLEFLLKLNNFNNIKIVPWLVCKPTWMWKIPFSFFLARIIPFRGDVNKWIPEFLKGKSKTLLSICTK